MSAAPTSPAVVTRFAPSPTGYLHVGGARTALFSWLLARHSGGRYLLRIEDTDLARSTEQATTQLLEDLRWLGLHWDNEQLVFQSKRQDVYNRVIDDLISRGLAYEAWETPEELDAQRKDAEKAKRQFVYRRREVSADQVERWKAGGRKAVVRFAVPTKEYRFRDVVLGKDVVVPPDQVQDFVIRKADGMPTYHFAVVVDDAEMGITHVLRGQEHTLNTMNHIALQEALGYPRPTYGHLPIILNPDNSKMGKRDRDKKIRATVQNWVKNKKKSLDDLAAACGLAPSRLTEWVSDSQKQLDLGDQKRVMDAVGMKESDLPEILVHDFRRNGYLPEALLNFLALLGWSPGGDREVMSVAEMIELFTPDGLQKKAAVFDPKKLEWMNGQHLMTLPIDDVTARVVRALVAAGLASEADYAARPRWYEQLVELLRIRGRTIDEVVRQTPPYLVEELEYDEDAVSKHWLKDPGATESLLRETRDVLATLDDWSASTMEGALRPVAERRGVAPGKLFQPLRVALTGLAISPGIFDVLELLGRERALRRLDDAIARIGDRTRAA